MIHCKRHFFERRPLRKCKVKKQKEDEQDSLLPIPNPNPLEIENGLKQKKEIGPIPILTPLRDWTQGKIPKNKSSRTRGKFHPQFQT